MIYLRKRLKMKIILLLLIAFCISGISIYYMTSSNNKLKSDLINDYKYLASLPAYFIFQCQSVEKSSKIPWELYAAYYQVNIEEKIISNYPKQDALIRLSKLFQSENNGKSLKEIIGIKIKDKFLVKKIYIRYKLLEKHSFLFSNEYSFPISNKNLYFTDTWGEDRDDGQRPHLGTDIFAPEGTHIYSITSGTIERIGWNRLGGNRIGIRGKDGLYYYYAHLKDFVPKIKTGDKISTGQLLGYVGNTGNAIKTPYHLHLGIEIGKDQWINPYNFLSYWKENSKLD